jgi:excisionase family DNA binding protein
VKNAASNKQPDVLNTPVCDKTPSDRSLAFRTVVTYQQAAALMGCSLRTVQRLVKSKDLEFTRLGKVKGLRIFVSSIEKYLEERTGVHGT